MKVEVLKNGQLSMMDGYMYLTQDRMISIIGKRPSRDIVAGSFEIDLPEKFDIWGGDAQSRKLVTEMLAKGKKIAGLDKKPAAKKGKR